MVSFHPPGMNNQLPGGVKAGFWLLLLPEPDIKGTIKILDAAPSHHGKRFHLETSRSDYDKYLKSDTILP